MASNEPTLINSYGLSLAKVVVISAFSGVAWYICTSLFVRIFLTFKKYKSVYFWALIVSSVSTFLMPTCYMLKDFQVANVNAVEAVSTLTWYGMVTGQAVVLYSRLHLIVVNRTKVRWVLYMIIFNFLVLHLPTTFLTYTSHSSKLAPRFNPIYSVYEKIQMTGFFLQEVTISCLYIWETRRILKIGMYIQKNDGKAVMQHLIYVNIFIVILDLALLSTEFAGLFQVQTVFKAAVYSIKLDLEFSILNRLRNVIVSSRTVNGSRPAMVSSGPTQRGLKMRALQPTNSESNLSTTDLVDRNETPAGQVGIIKVTEIDIDNSARQNSIRDIEKNEDSRLDYMHK